MRLVGNGGGYGYGVMGPTHHAIEDYGVLLSLPHMSAYVPVFDEDLSAVVARAGASDRAAYLRLGRGEKPAGYTVPAYAPWRQLIHGGGDVVIAVGPLAGSYLGALLALPEDRRPNLWAVAELPLDLHPAPPALWEQVDRSGVVCVAEEHVRRSGFGAEFALHMADAGIRLSKFHHMFARAHHYPRYGSQPWLRQQSGLDPATLVALLAGR